MARGQKEADRGQEQIQKFLSQFLGLTQQFTGPAGQAFERLLRGEGNDKFEDVLAQLANFNRDLPGLLRNPGMDPAMSELFRGSVSNAVDRSNEIVNNQGRTNRSDFLFDRLVDLTQGDPRVRQEAAGVLDKRGRTPEMAEMTKVVGDLIGNGGFTPDLSQFQTIGQNLLATGGQTADTRNAVQQFQEIMRAGGQTPQTGQMFSAGQGLVGSGGMTPALAGLLQQVNQGIASGGMTPEARQLFGKVMEIVNAGGRGGALLPMEQVISGARDEAATQVMRAGEGMRRQLALNQGDAAFAGPANMVAKEFADQSAQAQAAAVREAQGRQQELQLQQLLGSMGVGSDMTKAAQTLLGQFMATGGDIARSSASNIATGAGLMGDSQSIANQRFGIATQGFGDTLGLELARLNAGGQFVDAANRLAQGRLGLGMDTGARLETIASNNIGQALSALMQDAQNRVNAGQGAGSVLNTEFGREGQALGSLLGAGRTGSDMILGSGRLNLDTAQAQIAANLQSLGLSGDMAQALSQQFLQAAAGQGNLGQQFSSVFPTLMSGSSGIAQQLISNANTPGFWSQFGMNALNAGVGALTGGLGGLISRPRIDTGTQSTNNLGGFFGNITGRR